MYKKPCISWYMAEQYKNIVKYRQNVLQKVVAICSIFWQNEDYLYMKTTLFCLSKWKFVWICWKLFPSVIGSWRSILKHIATKRKKRLHMHIIHSWWQVEFDWRFPKAYFYRGGQFQVTIHWCFIQHQTCLTLLSCQWAYDAASKEAFCNMFRIASIFPIIIHSGQKGFVRVIYLSVTAKATHVIICCPCWISLKMYKHMYVGKFFSMLRTLSWTFAWLGRCEGSIM